jgi:hypothetical protein
MHREGGMSANYERLVALVSAARTDVEKAEEGNKAATGRVRKMMQDVKVLAQDIRKEMLSLRQGARPTIADPSDHPAEPEPSGP